ncbi:MAG: translation initiation factor IF-2 [Alphaproteobacteria bacterium]|nr:translation initiation factor IF-2 [Alphaproteobacteria bacterium]
MTDSTETKQSKPLTLGSSAGRLDLKPKVEAGQVRQKFSHGRTKSVTVEVKKKRVVGPTPAAHPATTPTTAPATAPSTARALPPRPVEAKPLEAKPIEPKPVAAKPVDEAKPVVEAKPAPAIVEAAPPPPPPPAVTAAAEPVAAKPAPVPTPPPARPATQAAAPIAANRPAPAAGLRPAAGATARASNAPTTPAKIVRPAAAAAKPQGRGVVLKTLTAEEREARAKALVGSVRDDEERRRQREEAVRLRAEDEERQRRQREEAERRAQEEEARKKRDEEARQRAEGQAQKHLRDAQAKADNSPVAARRAQQLAEIGADDSAPAPRRPPMSRPMGPGPGGGAGAGLRRPAMPAPKRPTTPGRREDPKRRTGKVDVNAALNDEDTIRGRSVAALKRATEKERRKQQTGQTQTQKLYREVTIPETITVQELAARMSERGVDVIRILMKMGQLVTINQVIDADTAELVVSEMGHTAKRVTEADIEVGLGTVVDADEALLPRPPVVTIMGHVDHGKTSLLDALRSTDVAAHEAGGITQHIGAYQVTLEGGQKITFLDTPGHEAFTAMRSRGAKVTDIVVLVVAADDGIMPQTIEAIAHAKAAKVPMIVAINKIDKGGADPARVRQALLQHEVQVEEFGGDVQSVEVSATKKINLDKLQEAILLQAEVLDLKANPDRLAEGTIVEAKLDPGRGSVATVLVQRGTLHGGDVFVAGAVWGRVRRLVDDRGQQVDAAPPAYPVEVLGLNGTPEAGDEFHVVDSEARAREIAEFRARRDRQAQLAREAGGRGSLEEMLKGIREGTAKDLPVVIKADVQGSVEAIAASLQKLSTEKVAVRVLYSGVGGINESDVTLARASNAVIIGFNVRANPQAREVAKRDKIEIRYYSIIYNVVDDVKALMTGLLDPTYKENFLGYAEIRQVFKITKVGNVAGCMITEGVVKRGAKVRLLRDNTVIHEGTLKTLKRFKDEVREVNNGFECGMAFENYEDIRPGDQIECFEVEEVRPTL